MNNKKEVLKLYKDLLKFSKNWIAKDNLNTEKERRFINDEIKTRFKENKNLKNDKEIKNLIQYGYDRMNIAIHYKIPYERPMYYSIGVNVKKKRPKNKEI